MVQCPAPFEIRFLHCHETPSKWIGQKQLIARGHWYCPSCGTSFVQELPMVKNVPKISSRPSCPKHGRCGVVINCMPTSTGGTVRFACLSQHELNEQPIEIDCQLDIQLDGWVVSRWLVPPRDLPEQGIEWLSYCSISPQGFSPRRIRLL